MVEEDSHEMFLEMNKYVDDRRCIWQNTLKNIQENIRGIEKTDNKKHKFQLQQKVREDMGELNSNLLYLSAATSEREKPLHVSIKRWVVCFYSIWQ